MVDTKSPYIVPQDSASPSPQSIVWLIRQRAPVQDDVFLHAFDCLGSLIEPKTNHWRSRWSDALRYATRGLAQDAILRAKLGFADAVPFVLYENGDLQPLHHLEAMSRTLSKCDRDAAQLRQAVGLLTTLHPSMVMRPDDPIGMAQEVAEKVRAERATADMNSRAVFDIGRALEGDEFGACSTVESTVKAARDVLPKIAKLRKECSQLSNVIDEIRVAAEESGCLAGQKFADFIRGLHKTLARVRCERDSYEEANDKLRKDRDDAMGLRATWEHLRDQAIARRLTAEKERDAALTELEVTRVEAYSRSSASAIADKIDADILATGMKGYAEHNDRLRFELKQTRKERDDRATENGKLREFLEEIRIAAVETGKPWGQKHANWIRELRAQVDKERALADKVSAERDDLRQRLNGSQKLYQLASDSIKQAITAVGGLEPECTLAETIGRLVAKAEQRGHEIDNLGVDNSRLKGLLRDAWDLYKGAKKSLADRGETITKVRYQLDRAEKYSERLKVPLLTSDSLPPNYLHTAHVPGDWSSMADEWFVYHRHYVMGEPTPFVMVSWRHGPGIPNSDPAVLYATRGFAGVVERLRKAELDTSTLRAENESLKGLWPKHYNCRATLSPKREPEPLTRPPCTDPGDLLELAWGLLANVSGGDWHAQDPKWHGAMIAWRDDWHRYLNGRNEALAKGALGVKVGIVRDPLTGWTFDKFRRELEAGRTENERLNGLVLSSQERERQIANDLNGARDHLRTIAGAIEAVLSSGASPEDLRRISADVWKAWRGRPNG